MLDTRNKKKKEIRSDNRTYDVVGEKVNITESKSLLSGCLRKGIVLDG